MIKGVSNSSKVMLKLGFVRVGLTIPKSIISKISSVVFPSIKLGSVNYPIEVNPAKSATPLIVGILLESILPSEPISDVARPLAIISIAILRLLRANYLSKYRNTALRCFHSYSQFSCANDPNFIEAWLSEYAARCGKIT
jgi:hypothetical protein